MSDYAKLFDAAMKERFPDHSFETSWNVLAGAWGGYMTILDGDYEKQLTDEMGFYRAGWSNGWSNGYAEGKIASEVEAKPKKKRVSK